MIGACLYGSAVGWGKKNGILARMNLRSDSVHCLGHCDALIGQHTKNSIRSFVSVNELLRGIGTDFWASTKKASHFRELQLEKGNIETSRNF